MASLDATHYASGLMRYEFIFQLLKALGDLQHDVQLDLRGEWNALALHEVLEVAVRAEFGDDREHGVGAVADVALERGVILELLEGAAGVPVHLRGDGREACVWVDGYGWMGRSDISARVVMNGSSSGNEV